MLELFRAESESQAQVLTCGLLALERQPDDAAQLEACMRAAHSLKGAARIVGLDAGVAVAHAMEDCFVAAQRGALLLARTHIDLLLRGLDLLTRIGNTAEAEVASWNAHPEVEAILVDLARACSAPASTPAPALIPAPAPDPAPETAAAVRTGADPAAPATAAGERVLRVAADNLNRMLGLASQSLVESRWLQPFAQSLLRTKRNQQHCSHALDQLRESLPSEALDDAASAALVELQRLLEESRLSLQQRLLELEAFDARSATLAQRLYGEALSSRMRPFADGTRAWPRMLRDVAQALGKSARLELAGLATQVDRDIL